MLTIRFMYPLQGGRDFLVLTEPLLERLEEKEKDVEVIRVKKIDLSEHCDLCVFSPLAPLSEL